MVRVRFLREQWVEWVQMQAVSGLPASQFCKLHEIPLPSFYIWRTKLADKVDSTTAKQPLFIPLQLSSTSYLEVDMPCGAKLRVPDDKIQNVLQVLHQLGGRT